MICSFPRQSDSYVFDGLPRRQSGAGIGAGEAIWPAASKPLARGWARGVHSHRLRHALAEGKETREINGHQYVARYPIHADFALIKAYQGDRWGDLVYRKTARDFGPIMAAAAQPPSRK